MGARRWPSADETRRREVAVSQSGGGGRWGSHCVVVVTSVCDWRTSKGLAREGAGRWSGGMDRGEERRGRSKGEDGGGGEEEVEEG